MTHDAQFVAVRVANIGTVVSVVVVWAQTWCALVAAAVGKRKCMAGINQRPIRGLERDHATVSNSRRSPV